MLNNKGFAVSIILYSISAIIIVILLMILAVNATNAHNHENMVEDIKQKISGLGTE